MKEELLSIKENPVVFADKASITGIVDNYIEDIAFNGGDVLKDWAVCEKYALLIKQMQEKLKPYVIKELSNYDRREGVALYTDLKVVSTPTKYDFSDNEAWLKQKQVVDSETAKLKDIETFIKSLREKTSIVNEETGEVTDFYPVTGVSGETIRSTIR